MNNKLARCILIILCIPVVIGCWIVMLIPMVISLYKNVNGLVMSDINHVIECMELKR